MGDIYALLTAVCWSFAVILFELSSNKLNPLQINIVKNLFNFTSNLFNKDKKYFEFNLEDEIIEKTMVK